MVPVAASTVCQHKGRQHTWLRVISGWHGVICPFAPCCCLTFLILFLWFLWCLKRNLDWVSWELCMAPQDHWLYTITHIASVFFSIPLAVECKPQLVFAWRSIQYTWNQLPQGRKHSPAIYHGLIQVALEKGEAPECLQYIDDIIWGCIAEEVFERRKKVIHTLLEGSFALKQRKVKGPALEIQFLGIQRQNRHHQFLMNVMCSPK